MLKKIIIGLLCFIFLVIVGLGIYIYMLDWNQHKKLVEERFSQITGLKAVINGNLNVELFPSPKFTASQVNFFQNAASREPLVQVSSISANVDFWAMLHQKFILSSMNLTGTTVHYTINEEGTSNWKTVGNFANNHSGNIEVSFNDVHLANSTFKYNNLQTDKHFEIPGISGFVSAPSLNGPYRLNLQFIHNENEIKIGGNVVKNNALSLDLTAEIASTASKITLNGQFDGTHKGNLSIDTGKLADLVSVAFGANSLPTHYNIPFYLSFQYEGKDDTFKLNNFNIAYGAHTKGNGTVVVNFAEDKQNVDIALDMSSIDLTILETIGKDIVSHLGDDQPSLSASLAKYNVALNMKSGRGLYRNAEIQNLNLAANLENSILSLSRFNIDLPGTTSIKTIGKIDFNNVLDYTFDNNVKTNDLRAFVSLFGIDLAKLAPDETKKSIFKNAESSFNISGNMDNLKLKLPQVIIDNVELHGNMGFVFDSGKTYIIADLNSSQILFDKYVEVIPEVLHNSSLEKKLVYQFNLIPWNHDLNIDARIFVPSAVYNKIPLQNLILEAKLNDDNLLVKKLSIENIAGANLQIQADAQNIYSTPYFKELSYDVKTNNLPSFAANLGISTGSQKLFHRKLFAAQGALNGSFNNLNISSIQKFGDVEFAYTGTVTSADEQTMIDGSLELKSNNFTDLVHALNLDYTPEIPVTTFALSGEIKGSARNFSLNNLSAYLGANNIRGSLLFKKDGEISDLTAKLDFDKFDADRYLNLGKLHLVTPHNDETHPFIAKPDILADKIDYSLMKKVNYNISAKTQQLVYNNKLYTNTVLDTDLKDGILNVSKFSTQDGNNEIELSFTLNSNNIPEIEGDYDIKSFSMPVIGGKIYEIQNGSLNSKGHFKSVISSAKDFVENLNGKGTFSIADTTIKGWDLDLIKFELEQRKTTEGLESSVITNLKNGLSSLSSIEGDFVVSKGLLVSDNALIDTPVANLSMNIDFNLSNWMFTANFDTIYRNATFSDVIKYTFSGNLADPKIKVDLSESLKRIGATEAFVQKVKEEQEEELQQKLSDKIDSLRRRIDAEVKNASQMDLYLARYKPLTEHSDVLKAYDINILSIEEIKKSLSEMTDVLKNNPSEKNLMDIDARLSSIKSKLLFIPKSLEDNFMMDSKYIFNDLFDKIAWIYNVATNNSSYYKSLADVYWAQADLMKNSENPIEETVLSNLKDGQEIILTDIEKISTLHSKMRENYVSIVETTDVSRMKESNELTRQALQTLVVYTTRMNDNIMKNLDKFRKALNLSADDDAQYIIYPPQNIDDININAPTTMFPSIDEKEKPIKASKDITPSASVSKKKELTASLNLPILSNGLSQLVQKFQLSHTMPLSLAENSVITQKKADIQSDVDNQKFVNDSNNQIIVKDQALPVLNVALEKQAKEAVLAILSGSSFVNSLPNLTINSSSRTSSFAKQNVIIKDSIESEEEMFAENKIFDTSDLNLKSGFKKATKRTDDSSKPTNNLAVLDIISIDTTNTASSYKAYSGKEKISSNERLTSSTYENSIIADKETDSYRGNIGKSMLQHHAAENTNVAPLKTQYLFAFNGKYTPFSGTVTKNIFLDVK